MPAPNMLPLAWTQARVCHNELWKVFCSRGKRQFDGGPWQRSHARLRVSEAADLTWGDIERVRGGSGRVRVVE